MTVPAGKFCRDIDLLPLWMMTRRKQSLKIRKQRIDEIGDVAIAVGKMAHISCNQDCSDRDRVGRLFVRDKPRIIDGGDPAWNIGSGATRRERDAEQMKPIGRIEGLKKRIRLCHDKCKS